MNTGLLLDFCAFAFVMSATPGPNNTMLLASGVNFGFRRTVPHILGISVGMVVMLIGVGLGLGSLFAAFPPLYTILRWGGAAYLLYLAWKIARAGAPQARESGARPMRFLSAAGFQWLNPKAWVMVMSALTIYTPRDHFLANMVLVAVLFGIIAAPSCSSWAGFGVALRRFLDTPGRVRAFNLTMAMLLVLSLYPLLES